MRERLPPLDTTDAVIDFLGGNGPAGEIVGARPKTVSNWRKAARGRFPAETFLALNRALSDRGRRASPDLWGMIGQPSLMPEPSSLGRDSASDARR